MSSEPKQRVSAKELLKSTSTSFLGPRATSSLLNARRSAIDWTHRRSAQGRRSGDLLERTRGRHAGETCVIIGNGPSLNETPLELLQGIPTFGLNRIYLMYDKLGFETTYHVVVNSHVVEQRREDFAEITAPLFTTWKNRKSLRSRGGDTGFLSTTPIPNFAQDVLSQRVWEGATVTYVAMQLAFHMGYAKVLLVGVDHRFVDQGPAHKLVESRGPDLNHFDPNYFGPGFKWQLPDLQTSEIAYALAKKNYKTAGREIVDCTVGGALNVFRKSHLREELA